METSTAQQHAGERSIRAISAPLQPMPGSDMGGRLVLGQGSGLAALDPFVALMHDDVPPWVHFPMHQHRSVEIVTYGVSGGLYHEDSLGNSGTVEAGGAERNLFGRGYYHSEAPVGEEHYTGFQLFILLKPEEQQLEPTFQLLQPGDVPEVRHDGALVRVVAGEFGGQRSPMTLHNPTLYLDARLEPGASLAIPIPAEFQGLAYVLSGTGVFGTPPQAAGANQRLVLGRGQELRVAAEAAGALRFVLITGRPIFGSE